MGTEGYEELLRQIRGCFERADELPDGSKERLIEIMNAEKLLKIANDIYCNGEDVTRKNYELEMKKKLYEENARLKEEQIKADKGRANKTLAGVILNVAGAIGIGIVGYVAENEGTIISKWFNHASRLGRP